MYVDLNPKLLTWARERAGLSVSDLAPKFAKLKTWEDGSGRPTIKQLEKFAKAVRVPFGFLFLDLPPEESLPIPDFRTIKNTELIRPSPDLIETIHDCQEKQAWYIDYSIENGLKTLDWIDSESPNTRPIKAAMRMRNIIDLQLSEQIKSASFDDFLRLLVSKIEDAGVMVLVNGVVGQNSWRPLSVEEFRGFTLVNNLAPLIFINGRDSKAAQLFTLAHEFAHLLAGKTGLSNMTGVQSDGFKSTEIWCNRVASEFLVPRQRLGEIAASCPLETPLHEAVRKEFKVSDLVALIALKNAKLIDKENFEKHWKEAQKHWKEVKKKHQENKGGGDYYRTSSSRNGKRLTRAVIADALGGKTLYRDAFSLLNLKESTFKEQAKKFGMV